MPDRDVLTKLFAAHGRDQFVGGNTPVLLGPAGSVWLVASGRVEVFAVPMEDGRPTGARRHFFTADEGHLLVGMAIEMEGPAVGLLAVGAAGTRLAQIDLAQLRVWGGDPALGPAVAESIDRWVKGLALGISREVVPKPRSDVLLEPNAHADVTIGRRVTSRHGLVWTRGLAGALFIDMEPVSVAADAGFPVAPEIWLQSSRVSTLDTQSTAAAMADGTAWAGLDSFHAAILACEFFNSQLTAADELNRLDQKSARDARTRSGALADLASVLVGPSIAVSATDADDPLLAACSAVGRQAGIDVEAPARQQGTEGSKDRLADIAAASGFRTRRVALRGDWWKEDAGPLLGYTESGERPVALVRRHGHYERYDPAEGTSVRVDRAVAASIDAFAHTFYRPLPGHRLGPMDMWRFATFRRGRDLALSIVVGIAGGLLGMAPPHVTGLLVDTLIPAADRRQVLQIAIVLMVIAASSALFEIVRGLANRKIEIGLSSALQPALWDRLLGLPVGWFRHYSAGDLAQRVVVVDGVRRVVSGVALSTLQTSLFSIFLLLQMFYYSWRLALVATAFVVLSLLLTAGTMFAKLRLSRETVDAEGRISGLVLQLLTGIAKIRVTGAEHRAFAEWAREFSAQKRLAYRMGRIDNLQKVFNSVFPILGSMGLFGVMLSLTRESGPLDHAISFGDFLALNAAAGTFLLQMTQLTSTILSMLLAIPYYERARPILEALPEVDESKTDPGEINGRIEISRVSFRYHDDAPLVLNDVSMTIEAGEYVAIVGPSGSGKSTLFRMLLGLESPTSGRVSYDGRDVSMLDVAKLRKRLGVVMQASQVRAGSIFENIVGALPLTMDDAWEAAKLAGLDADIHAMPMGMHTVLQQGGLTLSGGQRQRLMIARAIIGRPRVLLFDEATSALDNRTQAVVSRSLSDLQATRITIAHRLSTIIGADCIYVLDAGRIVQRGSFQELVDQPGMFQDLMRRQMA